MWNKKGFSEELKNIILWVIVIAFVLGLFFVLKDLLFKNASGVTGTLFGGLGFR